MEIVPHKIAGAAAESELGFRWTCPFCDAQSTHDLPDTGWVKCPIRAKGVPYICRGCCIDIASTCRDEDFAINPYKGVVADAADSEGRTVDETRQICLQHQIEILVERGNNPLLKSQLENLAWFKGGWPGSIKQPGGDKQVGDKND